MSEINTVWPDWKIVREIGEGGFGKVYEIVRIRYSIEEHRALKVIRIPADRGDYRRLMAEGMDADAVQAYYYDLVSEFIKEIGFLSQLRGVSHIVTYDDYKVIKREGDIGWDILIMMELLTPLTEITAKRTLTRQEVIRLGSDICDALEGCHSKNILHRDIKADNIFVTADGSYKLGDFGIARTVDKVTVAQTRIGTKSYMAPEVFNGKGYGKRADLYSLGILMYRLMNHNRDPFLPPYPAPVTPLDREQAQSRRLVGEPLPLPSEADQILGNVILKACAYRPEDRFASAAELKRAIVDGTAPQPSGIRYAPPAPAMPQRETPAAYAPPARERASRSPGYSDDFTNYRTSLPTPQSAPVQEEKKSYAVPIIIALTVLVMIAGGVVIFMMLRDGGDTASSAPQTSETGAAAVQGTLSVPTDAQEIPTEELQTAPPEAIPAQPEAKDFTVRVNINYDFDEYVPLQVFVDGEEMTDYANQIMDSGNLTFTISVKKDTFVILTLDGEEYYSCYLDYESDEIFKEIYNQSFDSPHIID